MFGVYACGFWDLNVILWESPSHNPLLSAWGVWKGVIHFLSPPRSGGLRGFTWIRGLTWFRNLGFGCLARGEGEWADRPRLSLPPSPEHVRANSPVEFTQDYLFPSPPYDGHPSGLRATKHTARRWKTAKAFLPASNVLSSLKTVTATPRGLACGTSSSSFILGLAVGGRVVFPPLQSVLSPPAGRMCGDTVDSPLQRSDPVLATCQSSTSHSINPDKDAKGSPSWRRVLTIRSGYTLQFGEYPPPPRRGSTDGSKQRLQGFCSTSIAFLPPTERSDRGNTAVGHRTRVLQPKGDGGLRPILDLRRFNFPSTKGSSRCWW